MALCGSVGIASGRHVLRKSLQALDDHLVATPRHIHGFLKGDQDSSPSTVIKNLETAEPLSVTSRSHL